MRNFLSSKPIFDDPTMNGNGETKYCRSLRSQIFPGVPGTRAWGYFISSAKGTDKIVQLCDYEIFTAKSILISSLPFLS